MKKLKGEDYFVAFGILGIIFSPTLGFPISGAISMLVIGLFVKLFC